MKRRKVSECIPVGAGNDRHMTSDAGSITVSYHVMQPLGAWTSVYRPATRDNLLLLEFGIMIGVGSRGRVRGRVCAYRVSCRTGLARGLGLAAV